MNADRKRDFNATTQSGYYRELTERVKRLEVLRVDACTHRDQVRVAFIDRQIKNTVLEWCDSYVMDVEASAPSTLKICRSPSGAVN